MLEQLGLSQYLQAFLNEGFDSWNILMDITESDLYDFPSPASELSLTARLERHSKSNWAIAGFVQLHLRS